MTQHMKTAAQQRWISNAMFLCDTLANFKMKELEDTSNSASDMKIEVALEEICTKMIEIFNAWQGDLATCKDHEIKSFYLSCKNSDGRIDNDKVNNMVRMQVMCMNSHARKIASKLIHKYVNGVKQQGDTALHSSLLGKAYKISYLNRVLCGFAEEVAKKHIQVNIKNDNGVWSVTDKNNDGEAHDLSEVQQLLLRIYIYAQRAKSSLFGEPLQLDAQLNIISLNDLMEKFKKAQSSVDSPFNKEIHRRRSQNPGSVTNPESYMLSIAAGSAFTEVGNDSTLGFVQRALNLPERCDISGTTTDAIGAGLTLCRSINNFDENSPHAMTKIYVLACITSMCLAGHHSLSEMGAALSLWSSQAFNPLEVTRIHKTIANIATLSGRPATFEDGWLSIANIGLENTPWYSDVWLALAGNKEDIDLKKWDFTQENWKVWHAFAQVSQSIDIFNKLYK